MVYCSCNKIANNSRNHEVAVIIERITGLKKENGLINTKQGGGGKYSSPVEM